MNRTERKAYLERFLARHRKLKKLQEAAYVLLGYDGTLTEATHAVVESAVGAISLAMGDRDEWLNWFIYENGSGEKGMMAKAAHWPSMRPISTVDDLLDLIGEPDASPDFETQSK